MENSITTIDLILDEILFWSWYLHELLIEYFFHIPVHVTEQSLIMTQGNMKTYYLFTLGIRACVVRQMVIAHMSILKMLWKKSIHVYIMRLRSEYSTRLIIAYSGYDFTRVNFNQKMLFTW